MLSNLAMNIIVNCNAAMETSILLNSANFVIDNFEQKLSRDYFQKTGLSPLIWFRFIDDIFIIWTSNKNLFYHFISFTQNYSKSKNMIMFTKFIKCIFREKEF